MLISHFKKIIAETDQGDCLTAFDYFKEIYLNCTWMTVVDCRFLVLTTDFGMSKTCELLSWYLRGCKFTR